jgi:hypothetical protein
LEAAESSAISERIKVGCGLDEYGATSEICVMLESDMFAAFASSVSFF